MCQKRNISERRSKGLAPFNHYFVCITATEWLGTRKSSSYTKYEYSDLFYYKLDAEYFFYSIFLKKAIFSEKTVKNCFGGIFYHFLGKGGILSQN